MPAPTCIAPMPARTANPWCHWPYSGSCLPVRTSPTVGNRSHPASETAASERGSAATSRPARPTTLARKPPTRTPRQMRRTPSPMSGWRAKTAKMAVITPNPISTVRSLASVVNTAMPVNVHASGTSPTGPYRSRNVTGFISRHVDALAQGSTAVQTPASSRWRRWTDGWYRYGGGSFGVAPPFGTVLVAHRGK
jgi:hypothetical protein